MSTFRFPVPASGGGPGSDTTAVHVDAANEISGVTTKATPASGDYLLIEDSAAANVKKKITVGSLPSGTPAADSINGTQIRLANDQYLRARNQANNTDVDLLKLNASDELEIGDGYSNINVVSPMSIGSASFRDGTYSVSVYAPPSSLTGNYDLVLPIDAGSAGQVLSTDGTGVTSWIAAGSGANTTLSNLGTTAINASLLFSTHATHNVGATNTRANFIFGTFGFFGSGPANGVRLAGSETMPSGATVTATIRAEDSQSMGVYTNNQAITKSLYLETGNASAGDSGSVVIQPGTASGTRGTIKLNAITQLQNNNWIQARDAADTSWVNIMRYDEFDVLRIGEAGVFVSISLESTNYIGLNTPTGTIDMTGDAINMYSTTGIDSQNSTFKNFVIENGVTGNRPADPVTGSYYFDTTINRPIWFDGTDWINAAGTVV